MATNDFLPFATAGGANVVTQSAYAALAALGTGYQSGVASSAQLNKTWRQSSIMAAVLAQFISDQTGANSVDDGTTSTLLSNLKIATAGRLLNVQVFATPGSYTYTSTAGTRAVLVEAIGGGGGGPGHAAQDATHVSIGGGSGGGSYGVGYFTSSFSGVTVTVGARGTGGVGAAVGGTGGTSSFGGLMSVPGGAGGGPASVPTSATVSLAPQCGAGGALPTGANVYAARGQGGNFGITNGTSTMGGQGGGSGKGGGNATGPEGSAPTDQTNPGAGASGGAVLASGAALTGKLGGPGWVAVWEYA